jgi:hypothetical protein
MDTNANHTHTVLYALGFEGDLFRRLQSHRKLVSRGYDESDQNAGPDSV